MKQKILYVVAAGSGGHILPALTLAKRWIAQFPGGKVVFWGSAAMLDKHIILEDDLLSEVICFKIDKLQLRKFWLFPCLLFQIIDLFIQSFVKAVRDRPEKVISTGGLISIPVCLSCWISLIPIEIYELNVIPGKAVKFLMPFVKSIFVLFNETINLCKFAGISFARKCSVVEYPIRYNKDVFNVTKQDIINSINRKITYKELLFEDRRKTIFILGGSQGSFFLNELFKNFLKQSAGIPGKSIYDKIQIIHQIGKDYSINWVDFYKDLSVPAFVFSYENRIHNFYLLADLTICRAGAGTLFELKFFKKRGLVIPLVTSSTSHQVRNAEYMVKNYPNLFEVFNEIHFFSNKVIKMLSL